MSNGVGLRGGSGDGEWVEGDRERRGWTQRGEKGLSGAGREEGEGVVVDPERNYIIHPP